MNKTDTRRNACITAHKKDYLPIFRAATGAFRRYPGGATAIAEALGRNDSTLRNMFSPNTDSTPSLPVFFRITQRERL